MRGFCPFALLTFSPLGIILIYLLSCLFCNRLLKKQNKNKYMATTTPITSAFSQLFSYMKKVPNAFAFLLDPFCILFSTFSQSGKLH